MITSLTKTQEAQIPKYIKKYVDLASRPTDRKKATKAVQALYKSAGYKKPVVIFGQSPLSTAIMVAMTRTLSNGDIAGDDPQLDSQLNSQLYSQLYPQLDSQLDSQLNSQLYSQLNSQLYSQLNSQLYSQLRSQLDSQLNSQLYPQLDPQLNSQLYSQLRSQLDSQLNSQLYPINNNRWILVWWLAWGGWYAFAKYIGVEFDSKVLKIFMDFVTNVSFIIPYEGIAFVSETPKISWEEGKLHNTEGKAVEYADGYGLYSLFGVNFDEKLFKKVTSKKVTLKTIFSIENMEQRMAGLKLVGVEKLLKSKHSTKLDKSDRGNTLYKIEYVFDQTAYYLHYKCPSTGRVYVSGIDPEVGVGGDADECMGWKFGLSKEEYQSLKIES